MTSRIISRGMISVTGSHLGSLSPDGTLSPLPLPPSCMLPLLQASPLLQDILHDWRIPHGLQHLLQVDLILPDFPNSALNSLRELLGGGSVEMDEGMVMTVRNMASCLGINMCLVWGINEDEGRDPTSGHLKQGRKRKPEREGIVSDDMEISEIAQERERLLVTDVQTTDNITQTVDENLQDNGEVVKMFESAKEESYNDEEGVQTVESNSPDTAFSDEYIGKLEPDMSLEEVTKIEVEEDVKDLNQEHLFVKHEMPNDPVEVEGNTDMNDTMENFEGESVGQHNNNYVSLSDVKEINYDTAPKKSEDEIDPFAEEYLNRGEGESASGKQVELLPESAQKDEESNCGKRSLRSNRRKNYSSNCKELDEQHYRDQWKKMPCKVCKDCLLPDCKKCVDCKDKPKYGGKGVRKQRCKNKPKCRNPKPIH